jgi:hypothetical protein
MGELTPFVFIHFNIIDMRNFVHALTVAACICLGLLYALPSTAQASSTAQTPQQDTAATTPIRLSPHQLHAYAGYFQFSRFDGWVVQIRAVDSGILTKMLWLGVEFHMTPLSDSTFFSPHALNGAPMTITYSPDKNEAGAFTRLSLETTPAWNRVEGYKPYEPVAISRTAEQLKRFGGLYQERGDSADLMLITVKENQLVVTKLWNNDEFEALPDSAMHFFDRENLTYTLKFIKGHAGTVTGLIFFGREPYDRIKSPSLTVARMKAFEGKYRLKEDPDNFILITARDHSLVIKQLWDGKETAVNPLADFFFYNSAEKYPLYFSKDQAGSVTGALILNKDHFEKVKD